MAFCGQCSQARSHRLALLRRTASTIEGDEFHLQRLRIGTYELQPKLSFIQRFYIWDIWILLEIGLGLGKRSYTFQITIIFTSIPKPGKRLKTVIHSSKIDDWELYTKYWPSPIYENVALLSRSNLGSSFIFHHLSNGWRTMNTSRIPRIPCCLGGKQPFCFRLKFCHKSTNPDEASASRAETTITIRGDSKGRSGHLESSHFWFCFVWVPSWTAIVIVCNWDLTIIVISHCNTITLFLTNHIDLVLTSTSRILRDRYLSDARSQLSVAAHIFRCSKFPMVRRHVKVVKVSKKMGAPHQKRVHCRYIHIHIIYIYIHMISYDEMLGTSYKSVPTNRPGSPIPSRDIKPQV